MHWREEGRLGKAQTKALKECVNNRISESKHCTKLQEINKSVGIF